jgi:A/G-specific adenine glycosylase
VPPPAPDAATPAWSIADPEVGAVLEWWTGNARELPWRASRDVYAVWVAEVMSVQTTVRRAAPAWSRWMGRWPTVEALASVPLVEVLAEWQGMGYPRRARDLHRSARIVVRRGWPSDLTELPGVGPYVAAAVRCFANEEPILPLDVNVRRVLDRRFPGGIDISGDAWRAGQAIMEFGQRICSARPTCERCPVRVGCRGPGAPGAPGAPEGPAAGRPGRRTGGRPRFEGSVRQRRGQLLRQVIADGSVIVDDVDRHVAAGLAEDGLAVLADGVLLAPSG